MTSNTSKPPVSTRRKKPAESTRAKVAASAALAFEPIARVEPAVEAIPEARQAGLRIQAIIDIGNQALLFATVALPKSRIESIGVSEGGLMPVYTALCKPSDPARFSGKTEKIGALDTTRFCANLSPLMLNEAEVTLAVMFRDGSRAVQSATVIKLGSPQLAQALPTLKAGVPLLAEIGRHAGEANPMLSRVCTSFEQTSRLLENPYSGAFDVVIDGRAEGWVYNTLKPTERVEVVLMEGERPLAFGFADDFREDLRDAKKSDGCIKFSLPVPRRLYDGKPHALRVVVAEGGQMVGNGPRSFEGPRLNLTQVADVIEFEVSQKLVRAAASKLGERARELGFEREMLKVLAALDNSEWPAARRILDRLDEQLGELPLIGLYRGLLELKAKQFARSIEVLFAVVKQAPDFFWAHLALGDAYSGNGQFANAADAFDTAAKLAPNVQAIQARLQAMHLDNLLKNPDALKDPGIREKAIDASKRAILADPDNRELTDALHALQNPQHGETDLPSLMAHDHALANNLRHERIVVSVMLEAIGKQQKAVKV